MVKPKFQQEWAGEHARYPPGNQHRNGKELIRCQGFVSCVSRVSVHHYASIQRSIRGIYPPPRLGLWEAEVAELQLTAESRATSNPSFVHIQCMYIYIYTLYIYTLYIYIHNIYIYIVIFDSLSIYIIIYDSIYMIISDSMCACVYVCIYICIHKL